MTPVTLKKSEIMRFELTVLKKWLNAEGEEPGVIETRLFTIALASVTAFWIIWFAAASPLLVLLFNWLGLTSKIDTESMGQFGDLFGGITALFTAWAFAGVVWAGLLQRRDLGLQAKELADTREVLKKQQEVMDAQQRAVARQQFEASFFQLLQLSRTVTIEIGQLVTHARGAGALEGFADYMVNVASRGDAPASAAQEMEGLRQVYDSIYQPHESDLGPYFRTLYHVYKLIDTAPGLNEDEKFEYGNLVRAQISSKAATVIAVNGLFENGRKFKPLIEKYRILKHMDYSHRRQLEIPLSTYLPAAFKGRDEP